MLIQKAVTAVVSFAMIATYSLVALADAGRSAGELIVSGRAENGNLPHVIVNGEEAKSGRSVFSPSTITTPEGSNAILNLGKAGKVQLAANSTITLNFDNSSINGDLTSGSITVINAAQPVEVKTLTGGTVQLNSGETADAASGTAAKQTTATGTPKWLLYALIFGGATVGIILATKSSNDTVVGTASPTR